MKEQASKWLGWDPRQDQRLDFLMKLEILKVEQFQEMKILGCRVP